MTFRSKYRIGERVIYTYNGCSKPSIIVGIYFHESGRIKYRIKNLYSVGDFFTDEENVKTDRKYRIESILNDNQ